MKKHPHFMHLLVTDLSGVERAKTVWCKDEVDASLPTAGWIPSNALITCFGDLAPSKKPEVGDVNLVPVKEQSVFLKLPEQSNETGFSVCNIENLDQTPWACCLRGQLECSTKRLDEEFGLKLRIGLEQEFYLLDSTRESLNAYSLVSFFEEEEFLDTLARSMEATGIGLKSLHAENGVAQYELTFAPEEPLKACDQLVLAKSISRLCAVKMKRRITYSPLVSENKVGSGLHVHFSICDRKGTNINADANHQISKQAGAFLSGILKHLNALIAFTSPSLISGMRYQPPRWTAYFNNFALQDRKAAIRQTCLGDGPEPFHFEFRTADAAASPYLVLSALIHAGCNGIEEELTPPQSHLTNDLLNELPEGISRLPLNLQESLDSLVNDAGLIRCFPNELIENYLDNKNFEQKIAQHFEPEELFQRYSQCY